MLARTACGQMWPIRGEVQGEQKASNWESKLEKEPGADEDGRAKLGMPNTEQEIARPCKIPARNSMTSRSIRGGEGGWKRSRLLHNEKC